MSITVWEAPIELFASVSDDDFWLESRLSQTNNPVIADADTPSSTYKAGQANDYTIYLQAESWNGDVQAPLQIADTGAVSLPFQPFSASIVQTSSPGQNLDYVLWWTPSTSVAGAYDIEFQNISQDVYDVDTSTPAIAKDGASTTLISGIVDPLAWASASDKTNIAFAYASQASPTTKNITLQVFSPTGGAQAAPIEVAEGAPQGTVFRIVSLAGMTNFEFVESATVNGVQGFDDSTVDTSTGALGTASFQAVPLGKTTDVIDAIAFSPLNNGDILEFVGYRDTSGFPYDQGVETRLLDSDFNDITSTTSGFASGGFDTSGQSTAAHWATASLENGDTILIYSINQVVTIEQFNASGDVVGDYAFSPRDSSGSAFSPTDFDSIVAMGARFEVTYQRTKVTASGTISTEYAVIYDTNTAGVDVTIDDNGNSHENWAGTAFDDTINYGAGINEINGGAGVNTFVATQFTASQVTISIDADDRAVFAVDANDVDTLENIQSITLADATVAIKDDALTTTYSNGDYDVSTFNITGQSYTRKVFSYAANGELVSRLYEGVTGEGDLTAFKYLYAAGELIGTDEYYAGLVGQPYTTEEVDFDGANRLARVALGDVSGAPYSSYEYDYVGGVFAGSKFTYTSVPGGASYSSYEVDYDQQNAFVGDRFFFTDVSGQPYTGEEEDFDQAGKLTRVLLTGVTGQAYSSLEEDYSAGVYAGYRAYYSISGASYTDEEVDVSASGALEKVVYSGMTGAPYSSVEVDYSNGSPDDNIYSYTDVKGQTYNSYQVKENVDGAALSEIFDLNNGDHTQIALASGQTLTSLGNDKMTGDGATTFVLDAIYGADTITNLTNADTVSMPSNEFANFSALFGDAANVGSDVVISAADGDTLTLKNMTKTLLASMSSDFVFHS